MTELELANAHLRRCQGALHTARSWKGRRRRPRWEKTCEQCVLAALSWVWDAQERKRIDAAFEMIELWSRDQLRERLGLEKVCHGTWGTGKFEHGAAA